MTNTAIITDYIMRSHHDYTQIEYFAKDIDNAKLAVADLRAMNNGTWKIRRRANVITLDRV